MESKKILPLLKFPILLGCLLGILIIIPKDIGPLEDRLTGSWYHSGESKPVITFYSDGTCKSGSDDGTWAIVNDNLLKLTDPWYGSEIYTIVSLKGGCLTLEQDSVRFTLYNKPMS